MRENFNPSNSQGIPEHKQCNSAKGPPSGLLSDLLSLIRVRKDCADKVLVGALVLPIYTGGVPAPLTPPHIFVGIPASLSIGHF